MELANLELKLLGNPSNTVIKTKVSPAELAVYAFLHGEDCVGSLGVTMIDKRRTILEEMDRLRSIFTSEQGLIALNKLFPGMAPQLPITFKSIGYDPDFLSGSVNNNPALKAPAPDDYAINAITEKIKKQSSKAKGNATVEVTQKEIKQLTSEEDDDDDDFAGNNLDEDEDPLETEMNINKSK